MDFTNSGTAIYHEIQAIYARRPTGELLHVSGRQQTLVSGAWSAISKDLTAHADSAPPSSASPTPWEPSPSSSWASDFTGSTEDGEKLLWVRELQRDGENQIVGILSLESPESASYADFRQWFMHLVLSSPGLHLTSLPMLPETDEMRRYPELIADLFDRTIRNVGDDDQWESTGRAYFIERLRFYTSRMARIDFCLPAFPCKSSNPDKVTGIDPDKGEAIALRGLEAFVEAVQKVYAPGVKVYIVSDGHVFSDCIGVNDNIVDYYSEALIRMKTHVLEEQNESRVGFLSLPDLFFSDKNNANRFDATFVKGVEVQHFLDTELTEEAELSRKVLAMGCQIDKAALKAQVNGPNQALLALYRGFSKFMLEDLALHPKTEKLSRSQSKKLSSKIAFEMIYRNQAYSNLIELVLPLHVRLSIHAHKNSGPKFGVQLLSNETCKPIQSLEKDLQRSTNDLLHIPTPWHNCCFQLEGDATTYVTKAKVVRDGIASGKYEGKWVEGFQGRGGHFLLQHKRPISERQQSAIQDVLVKDTPAVTQDPVQQVTDYLFNEKAALHADPAAPAIADIILAEQEPMTEPATTEKEDQFRLVTGPVDPLESVKSLLASRLNELWTLSDLHMLVRWLLPRSRGN
ncbi:MAG: hypothetical protein M1817_006908 [Caeruleum heppii]|nr:MAG: hypothetical protein M1817_006908 [Caeruleum heppii]